MTAPIRSAARTGPSSGRTRPDGACRRPRARRRRPQATRRGNPIRPKASLSAADAPYPPPPAGYPRSPRLMRPPARRNIRRQRPHRACPAARNGWRSRSRDQRATRLHRRAMCRRPCPSASRCSRRHQSTAQGGRPAAAPARGACAPISPGRPATQMIGQVGETIEAFDHEVRAAGFNR